MGNIHALRIIIQEVLSEKLQGANVSREWEYYYHNLSNVAHHNLVATKLILDDQSLSAKEKNRKINQQYEIYLSKRRALGSPLK
jgi:hypothetical protein